MTKQKSGMKKSGMKKSLREQLGKAAGSLGIEVSEPLPPVVAPMNTAKQDPLIHLVGMMGGGASNYIEAQEKQGQSHLVNSTTLPNRLNGCTEDQIRALGIELGPKDKSGDDLFRPALLPKGWKKVPTLHSMWTDIVDEKGFKRASIFYKAAFYDRDAFMGLSVRMRVEEDYEARKADGTLAFDIVAMMPGRDANGMENRTVVHRHVHPEVFPDHDTARGPSHPFFLALDQARKDASAWLKENFPDHQSPLAYWDYKF